jgi:regulator of protease activity HflC (stomatin/prohibitin superfamily)
MVGGFFILLVLGSCTVKTFSTVIQPGDVGVKIKTIGAGSGVDPHPYTTGWQWRGIGERFVEYPVIMRPYAYAAGKDPTNKETNEEISFSDNNALPMTADVQIKLRVLPGAAPKLWEKYRTTFDDLITGQIRNDVRSAIAAETEQVPVEFLYKGGRQAVIQRALQRVRNEWGPQGVEIANLEWIGNIRYPDVILDAIQAKTKADADQQAAQAQVAVAEANARVRVAAAEGEAKAIQLRAEALRSSPATIEEIYAKASKGVCPPSAKVCIVGAGAPAVLDALKD